MPIPEKILAQCRPHVPKMLMYGVPIIEMTEDELRCMLVLLGKREQDLLERQRKDKEFLHSIGL